MLYSRLYHASKYGVTDVLTQVEVYKKLGFSIVGEPEQYRTPIIDSKIWVMARTKD